MENMDLPLNYLNQLAGQTLLIASLLCGFSLTVLVLLIDKKLDGKVMNRIFVVSTIATSCFLMAIFAMMDIYIKTTDGYPLEVTMKDFTFSRLVGFLALIVGVVALSAMIALFGWTRSRRLGIFTTVVGVITCILLLMMMS